MKKLIAGVIVGVIVGACGSAVAGSQNDTVFHEDQYREFFKQEGNGDKNYLYTITQQDAPPPGKCAVYTFASETAGTVACNFSSR
jgi:hypothetical protein